MHFLSFDSSFQRPDFCGHTSAAPRQHDFEPFLEFFEAAPEAVKPLLVSLVRIIFGSHLCLPLPGYLPSIGAAKFEITSGKALPPAKCEAIVISFN
ncbi:hypothetical protein PS708_00603 [Pseudomonas fluorescens]|nr:hypothetical protein PS708_00603 [Pseudomonas fluorescens]